MAVPLRGVTQDGDNSDSNDDSDGENSTGPTCFPLSDAGLPEGPPEELPEMPQEYPNGQVNEWPNGLPQEQQEQAGEKREEHQEEQEQEQEAEGPEDGGPAATERRETDQYVAGHEDDGLANHALHAVLAADVKPLPLPRPPLHQRQPEPKQRQEVDIAGTSPPLDAAEDQENRRGAMQRSTQEQQQQQQQQHAHWPRRRGRRGGAWPRNPVRRILDDYRNHGCSDSNCGSSGHGNRMGTPAWPAEQGVLVPADPNPPFSEGLFRHKRRELCRGIWGVPHDLIARCLVSEVDSLRELRG